MLEYRLFLNVHLQRVRKAESLAERSTSNGPLRAQSNESMYFFQSILRRTQALYVGNMLVFLKRVRFIFLTKQGGTAGELYTRP